MYSLCISTRHPALHICPLYERNVIFSFIHTNFISVVSSSSYVGCTSYVCYAPCQLLVDDIPGSPQQNHIHNPCLNPFKPSFWKFEFEHKILCGALQCIWKVSCKKWRKSINAFPIYANISYICAPIPVGCIDPTRLERVLPKTINFCEPSATTSFSPLCTLVFFFFLFWLDLGFFMVRKCFSTFWLIFQLFFFDEAVPQELRLNYLKLISETNFIRKHVVNEIIGVITKDAMNYTPLLRKKSLMINTDKQKSS